MLADDPSFDSQVQRCSDSTRFFAIQLVSDNGQRAMVGIGFPDRNDSFDFIAAMEDFKKQSKLAKGERVGEKTADKGKDFSLKEGEMIVVNIPGLGGKKPESKVLVGGGGGGLKKLAPPPG